MPVHERIVAQPFTARVLRAAALLSLLILALPAVAGAAPTTKRVTYHGYSVLVPRSWPVFNLAAHPSTCVRFNRHAVYVGKPGANQACPGQAIGRTEAILIEPSAGSSSLGLEGSRVTRRVARGSGVSAIATWNHSPALVERALGFHSVQAMAAAAPATPAPAPTASAHPAAVHSSLAHAAAAQAPMASSAATGTSTPGQIYTGKGFDVCSTPSTTHMSDWGSSPYRAIGVYIGGTNRACSQPNLTASWVGQESVAGWHVIPIYVGLQAPSNACGCAAISPSSAASEGTAAAADAVAQAQSIGMGTGNPLYFDMEGYSHTSANSTAVLSFLQAWTKKLHADRYLSGVYSSGGSGIADLVSKWGTGYAEPDELWFADWNGSASTSDGYVPSGDWANHQRLHQYSGGVNQTYGGVTMNIDQDYLDASTAAAGGASAASAPPADVATPTISGHPYVGQKLTEHHGVWMGSPTSYSYQWYRCASSGTCAAIAGATAQTHVVQPADLGDTIEVAETATNAVGPGAPATSQPTAAVQPAPTSSYWMYTAYGNVYNALGEPFYGSAARASVSTISAMAPTPDRHGYWLVQSSGQIRHYGDAVAETAAKPRYPVIDAVAAPHGGLYLLTAHGNVYNVGGAPFYGSPWASHKRPSNIAGMAMTPDGRGYWVVNAAGQVLSYGDAAKISGVAASYPVLGVAAAPGGGIWLWTSHGNIYNLGGAPFYNSPFHQGHRTAGVSGFAVTKDGRGYWVAQSGGKVLNYGDAESLPAITPKHPIIGMTS